MFLTLRCVGWGFVLTNPITNPSIRTETMWIDKTRSPCLHDWISNSAILSDDYILLLSVLCAYVQLKKMALQMKP